MTHVFVANAPVSCLVFHIIVSLVTIGFISCLGLPLVDRAFGLSLFVVLVPEGKI